MAEASAQLRDLGAVILAAAVTIDFDAFEWRGRRRNALDLTFSST